MSEIDDASQAVSVQGNMIPVKAEVVPQAPPVQAFDPETRGNLRDGSTEATGTD